MAEIDDIANRHRAALRNRESAAIETIVRDWRTIEQRLMVDVERLIEEISAMPEPNITRVVNLRRSAKLLRDVRTELNRYGAELLQPLIDDEVEAAVQLAQQHADELIVASLGPGPIALTFDRLNAAAVQEIIATTTEGPLANLLRTFGVQASKRARRDLIYAVATGMGPREAASHLRRSLRTNLDRAFLIARTEQLRAHREAVRQTYLANNRVVKGWIWSARLNRRTCVACWAMHGTFHDLDEPMGSHPACRCSQVPQTKTWAELGFPNVREVVPPPERGADVFARQPAAVQRQVLGPKGYELYRNGDITLDDLVKVRHSRQWGDSVTRASLTEALGKAEAA